MYLYKTLCVLCLIIVPAKVKGKVTDEEYTLMPEHFHLDNYDLCMFLGEKALYCNVKIQLAPARTNYSRSWYIIQDMNRSKRNYRHDWLRYGICVPRSCPKLAGNITTYQKNNELLKTAISECYTEKYQDLRLQASVAEINCETNKPRYSIDTYDIIVVLCALMLVVIVAFSTFYEGLARYKTKEEYNKITKTTFGKIISAFSLIKNWKRLGHVNNDNTNSLKCINGVRFHTVFLVITVHSGIMKFSGAVTNPWFAERMTEDFKNILLLNGQCVIQTFLIASAWLLSYNFFLLFEKQKHVRLDYMVVAFIHRYLRLTPCYLAVVAFSGTIMYHLGNGPLWDRMVGEEYRNCRMNWWANILYINNYYDPQHMCLLNTWYLATDTQLFLLGLVLLAIMWKFKYLIKIIIGVGILISILIPGVITYTYGYDILIRSYAETAYNLLLDLPEFVEIYFPAHTNLGGYMVGFFFGYIFYKYKDEKIKITKYHTALWWILTWSALPIILLGYPMYQDSFVYTRLGAAIYVGLARNLFAFICGIGVLGFTRKIGWFIRDCVMWSPIQILGRLTYCVYLVHYPLVRIRVGSARTPYYLSPYEFVRDVFSDVVMSYMAGLLLCLFVELPTSALQKMMLPNLSKKREGAQNEVKTNGISKIQVITEQSEVSKI